MLNSRVLRFVLVYLASGCERQPRAPETSLPSRFPSSAPADSILKSGKTRYDASKYDSASKIFEAARTRAIADGDSAAVARADTWRGLTEFHLGRYADAQTAGESALAMKLRLGMKEELFRSYNALGLLAYNRGRYGEASELFAHARTSAEAVGDSMSTAKAMGNLGMVHTDIGKIDQARQEYITLLRAALARHDTTTAGNALSNLGMNAIRAGDAGASISFLEQARALYERANDPAGSEMVFGQLGSAYSDLGQPQRALAYMDSALAIARAHHMLREETEDLELYAESLGDAGDHNTAIKYLAKAGQLADSIGLEARAGDIARAQARELATISRNDLALGRARAAVEIHKKAGAGVDELEDRLLLAALLQQSRQPDEAHEELFKSNQLARIAGSPVALENLSIGSARVADIAADPAAVLRSLPAELTFPHLGSEVAGEAEALRARAFARLHQWPAAASSGQKAIASFGLVRARLGEGSLRTSYTNDRANAYADLVVALLRLGRTNEAFEVADDARGKALLEHLNAVKSSLHSTSRDLSEADALLRRIDYLTERLRLADTIPSPERTAGVRKDLSDLSSRLADARSQYEDRLNTAARADPRGAALLGATSTRVRDVQQALRADEALVEYLVTEGRLFTFVATRDTVVASSRPVRLDELANRVRLASQLSANSRSGDAGLLARRGLYDLLVAPVDSIATARGARRLIVVPHSALTYLPFAALIAKDGRPLIERRALLTLPSSSALPYLRRNHVSEQRSYSVFAPFPEELAGSLAEARLVMREVGKSRSFIGSHGTERELRSVLERDGNVHIASHALLNQTNPMFSHVELARGRSDDPSDDGQLDVHELLRMNVKADLVYLSGCETGAGAAWSTSFRRGQDYATLSQALLFAGAQNVVATLWRIDDAGASVFAQRFYRALQTNDVVDALAIAQRETIQDSRYAAPRYWAGYTVSGSGVSRSFSQTRVRAAVR